MNYKAIIILCIMSFVSLCDAMEIPTKNSKIRALGFSTNNTIIIAGDHCCELYSVREKSSSVFDKEDADEEPIYDIAFSPDNKKMALVKAKKLVLYDLVDDNRKKKTFRLDEGSGCNYKVSLNDIMLYGCYTRNYFHIVWGYNYIADTTCQKRFQPSSFNNGVKSIGDSHPIIITDLDNVDARNNDREGNVQCHKLLPFTYSERFPSGEFNCDKSWLAINMSGEKYRFIDGTLSKVNPFGLDAKTEFEIPTEENANEDNFYISIAFHKNNITAALLKNNGSIEFWDYRNKTLLGAMYCKHGKKKMLWEERDCRDQLLSFSPDCKQFVATAGRKVYLYQTPCEAICTLGTKEHCLALLHALRNYSMEIPQDVRCHIIANLLWCSEFGNEKKVREMIFKIISQKDDKMARCDMEEQEEMSDEEDNDFCTPNLKKIYLYSMMVLAGSAGAMYIFGS